jgi:basic membrane protein A
LKISRRLVALTAASAILVGACGGTTASTAPTQAASTAPSVAAINYKACVAFDAGGLGDKGFNDLAKKGLEAAAALGYKTAFSESKGSSDFAPNIQRLLDQGCQTIVTVGFNQGQPTVDATKANADVAFAQVDTTWDTTKNGPIPANFTGIDFQIDQAAMLAGYLAAGVSKTGIIGTYGGQQFPGVTRFMDGYYAGIAYYNKAKGKTVKLLGWDAAKQTGTFVGGSNPWGDAPKGEQLAKTFVDQGADIVAPVAGSTGNGSLKYMLSVGKWGIGVDTDQAVSIAEYAGAILTSAEKVINVAVLETIKANYAGTKGGSNYVGTLANKGVQMSALHNFESTVSAELKAEVKALGEMIAAGTVKVADYLK